MKRLAVLLVAGAGLWLAGGALVRILSPESVSGHPTPKLDGALVERGAYLARVGNCNGCHQAPGGAAYAGGRGIATPFGTVYASNLTPDDETGLGRWSAEDFWHALHDGRSKDGRLLYPAFPYPQYTLVKREDADALHAYLRTQPAVKAPNRPHALRFPYDTQAALAAWRALFFRPGEFVPEPSRPAEWNRGAYLVQGLGHCAACHAERNPLGATRDAEALGGGTIPVQGWYAPSLSDPAEAGVASWPLDEVVTLLKTGTAATASVIGPMAEVVARSTQHWSDADARAVATYLTSLPSQPAAPPPAPRAAPAVLERGAQLYEQHCQDCHGRQGEGLGGVYPALAGRRAVTLAEPANVIKVLLHGGYAPATAGNPRPYGMPPYAHRLSDADLAAVATHVRQSWGHRAGEVTALQVQRQR